MRVRVLPDKCEGHGRCWNLAPAVFEADDLGNAHELHDGIVPPGSEREAHLAVDNCPEYAIEIVDD